MSHTLPLICLGIATAISSVLSQTPVPTSNPFADLKENELLQQYVTMSPAPMSEKAQVLQRISAVERSYLWRVHLGIYLMQRPNLTPDQQSVILDTLSIATPQLFVAPDPNDVTWRSKVHEPLDRLRRRALALFAKEEAAEIFSTFGGGEKETEGLRKYLALSQLRRPDRKAAFGKMSAQDKSSLFRVHFGLSLAGHLEWSETQRGIVLEAAAMLSPELYQIPKNAQWAQLVDEPVQSFVQRALLVFTKPEAAALFVELGGKEPKSHHAKPLSGSCACSHESDWCTYDCWSSDCTKSTWGCGTFGLYPCDGLCYWPPEIN